MKEYKNIFTPINVGNLKLKNRLVLPAMETCMSDAQGYVTDLMISYYHERAKGGVGLIILENTAIHPEGKVNHSMLCLHNDTYIPGIRKLVSRIHQEGAKVAIQLTHAGRQTLREFINAQPVAPSPIPCPILKEVPKELSIDEIQSIVRYFVEAALRGVRAGVDAIELHMAHGYLLCQFLSPLSNIRNDQYGGNTENRTRIAREIITAIKNKIGKNIPIICRISADEYIKGGLDLEESKKIAKILEEAGADALNVSACNYESFHFNMPSYYLQEGCFVHLANGIKEAVSIPVMTVGRIRNPEMAERILKERKADLICMGRALIADPYLPLKTYLGMIEEIRPCISCNRCIESIAYGRIICAVNPSLGDTDNKDNFQDRVQKILIVGGGPAGLEAAIEFSKKGKEVILLERGESLGGQLKVASLAPGKYPLFEFLKYLLREISKTKVKIYLNQELTPKFLDEFNPDRIIVATGASHLLPEIKGIKDGDCFTVEEAFLKPERLGQKVVIIGGGPEGSELADYLAQKGKKVTLIEMKRLLGYGLPSSVRIHLSNRLMENPNVKILLRSKVVEVGRKYLLIEKKKEFLEFDDYDTLVAATTKVSNHLQESKMLENLSKKVVYIGDAKKPRSIKEAIHEGFIVANKGIEVKE